MRILYHHRTLGDGAEGIHVAEMIKAFRALGHEVRLLSLVGDPSHGRAQAQRRWSYVARLLPGPLYEIGEMAYNLRGALSLRRAINEFRPDVIYDRYISYNYSTVAVGRRAGIPVLLEVNSPYAYQRQTFDERLYFKRIARRFERTICEHASRVIVVSTPLKKFLVCVGVPAHQIVVMPNGTDPALFHPGVSGAEVRARYGLADRLVIGFTGILRPWHGLELLVEAFAAVCPRHPTLHLLIVGDGPSRSSLERLIRDRRLADVVTITGRQAFEAVRTFVAAMDIAVSPRATFYASPLKIVEYMGMSKAVVAPDMENIRDIVDDGRTAILFQPEDPRALADALGRLVSDAALRRRLGAEARRTIERERTWLHNARRVTQIVDELREAPETRATNVLDRRVASGPV